MKTRFVLMLLAALLPAAPAAAEILPPFTFEDAEGDQRSLADFAGKVVLLDFWASWCLPCVTEIPALQRLQRAYGARGLAVVPVSIDKSGLPKVRFFYRRQEITDLPAFMDDDHEAVKALGIETVPVSMLIGRDGRVIARHDAPHDWEADAALIEKALAEQPDPRPGSRENGAAGREHR